MLWLKFARRYMFSPKSHSVINIIASVSVVAVAIPTAAMVILIAMFGGLCDIIEELYSSVDADIELIAERGQTFDQQTIDIERLRGIEGVAEVAPYIEQGIMISSAGRRATVTLRGVDSSYMRVLPLEQLFVAGEAECIDEEEVVLGSSLAHSIGAHNIGSEVELYALNRKQISTLLPVSGISRQTTRLGGIIVANSDIDENLALGELHATQRLLNYDGRLSGIAISLTESANVERVSRAIESLAGEGFTARSREQKNASMNHILRMERFAIVLIGAMIALVATLSVVGSVIMLITDKRRDIATLRAMGANRRLIHQIFVGEGMLLCSVGCLAGIILGLALCLGQQHFGWVRIPGASSIVEFYPVSIELIDSLTIALIVLLLGWAITASTVRITLRKL